MSIYIDPDDYREGGEQIERLQDELRDVRADYEQRIESQKMRTANLQAQIEAEHTKLVKARMVLVAFIEFIPDHMLEPGPDNNPDLIQAHHMAAAFLEDTK